MRFLHAYSVDGQLGIDWIHSGKLPLWEQPGFDEMWHYPMDSHVPTAAAEEKTTASESEEAKEVN